jgi:hypothetical protein
MASSSPVTSSKSNSSSKIIPLKSPAFDACKVIGIGRFAFLIKRRPLLKRRLVYEATANFEATASGRTLTLQQASGLST